MNMISYQENKYWIPPTKNKPAGWNNLANWNNELIISDFYECDRKELKKVGGCVYMIGDFYIGTTSSPRSRLLSHFKDVLRGTHSNKSFSKRMLGLIQKGQSAKVSILFGRRCVNEECKLIRHYLDIGFPLTNIVTGMSLNSYANSIDLLISKYKVSGNFLSTEMVVRDLLILKNTSK